MIWFKLTDEGLRRKVYSENKRTNYQYVIPVVGLGCLSLLLILRMHWMAGVTFALTAYCTVEYVAYQSRKKQFVAWQNYRIGLDDDLLVEEKHSGEITKISKHHVVLLSESSLTLLVADKFEVIHVPMELENYEQLRRELNSWGNIKTGKV
ncbi:MAG: hypothetical protein AAF902_17330 [Chloroflexota bacterium]